MMTAHTSAPIGVASSSRVLNVAVLVLVLVLAGAAFVLSFEALRDLAAGAGFNTATTFLLPVIVDGFILTATGAAFALKPRGVRVSWYPWAAVIVFSAISVTGNALHVASPGPHLSVPVWVAACVSAVPPVALLVASHLLIVMIDTRPHTVAAVAAETSLVEPGERREAGKAHPAVASPVVSVPPAPARVVSVLPGGLADGVERFEAAMAAGESVSAVVVAGWLGVSERTARRRMQAWRDVHRVPARMRAVV